MTPAELAADLRTRINPKYAHTKHCESYLNRACAEAIEGLIAENEKLRDALRFYDNPVVYEADGFGRRMDIRFVARAALGETK